jgi:hypothetical protein
MGRLIFFFINVSLSYQKMADSAHTPPLPICAGPAVPSAPPPPPAGSGKLDPIIAKLSKNNKGFYEFIGQIL